MLTTDEHQARIEQFIALDALAMFLGNLGEMAAVPLSDSDDRR